MGVPSVLLCRLDHQTRQFVICWLCVYAWLHVKMKATGTGGRTVLSCSLDHLMRQFVMCWLRVYAWLHVEMVFVVRARIKQQDNFFAQYLLLRSKENNLNKIILRKYLHIQIVKSEVISFRFSRTMNS